MTEMKYELKKPEEIEIFIPLLRQYLKNNRINEEQCLDIILCLRESLNNAFLHGGQKGQESDVKVETYLNDASFSFLVSDGGCSLIKEASEPKEDISEHGRGLWLMGALLDEVYLEKGAVGGRLTIRTDE